MEVFFEKLKEVLQAVLPITLLVVFLHFTLAPLPQMEFSHFLVGALLIVIGLSIFLFGVDIGITPIGNFLGKGIARSNSLKFVLVMGLLLGFFISIAEPDLIILAGQVEEVTGSAISSILLLVTVSIGVAALMTLGLFRIVYRYPLRNVFLIIYIAIFILAYFSSSDLFAIAFDASGSTTGALTVPFMLALALGVSSLNRDSASSEIDSFGLVGISSSGAILAVLVLGLFVGNGEGLTGTLEVDTTPYTSILAPFTKMLPEIAWEVVIALAPILLIFLMYQFFIAKKKLSFQQINHILLGVFYLYIGLVLFLTGVNAGFMNVGRQLGMIIGGMESKVPLLVIGFVLGLVVILAEPAVYVLTHQIEEVTNGSVNRGIVLSFLSAGVGLAVFLSVIRVLVPWIQLWHYLVPGYIIALILAFKVPNLFVGMAFDAGGVASGPMTATFILAFIQGVADIIPHADVLREGFGMIAMVAMMPILSLQLLGAIYEHRSTKKEGVHIE
ncbi:DUF1538 domain-containing protein [Jeotgalibaca sp. MA1X17-3]|uniref:DUF1538 domain-containing protein n=1 Tax=Jeotgalibaca sp. MA1X17-3 TaxID=2908211 RepID=UPI001F1A7AD3|nr:DUF1538 domain-containing protein [Jeotgalibaca sp. MA1X17-3]UJF15360.1 DUF1538 domain-containing protein [Jeotgalibaca sp. MA1X17-3]